MNFQRAVISLTVTGLLFAGCSSFKRPESIEEKMARFEARNLSLNKVPSLNVATDIIDHPEFQRTASQHSQSDAQQTAGGQRSPASLSPEPENDLEIEAQNYSNKRLYFLTLHSQYKEIKQYVGPKAAPELNQCPSFHTSFVQESERELIKGEAPEQTYAYRAVKKMGPQKLQNSTFVAHFPELQLSLSRNSKQPTVADYFQNHRDKYSTSPEAFRQKLEKKVSQALEIHAEQTYHELKELCDYGSSDNYYTYENLVTHTQRQNQFDPTSKNTQILLRTTLFSNMAILRSLEKQRVDLHESKAKGPGRSIASSVESSLTQDTYSKEARSRTRAEWVKDYFDHLLDER